ncbi:hypothetical protein GCM10009504_38800 [Pseudomonas laurentiana]|uniref:Uncharacterized protein n=2 Tax=Pseudomonas laurentiana TaxID=2364649 RepID=A0A6I5RKG6_9PSED|nr:hypothetical protein [Pseudomonas laurentiana]GGU77988.1 hypothetical protein GCM10009504_38800 [Pseudomonas laurentiana]
MSWDSGAMRQHFEKMQGVLDADNEILNIEDYVDQFLRTRGYALTDESRLRVAMRLEQITEWTHYTASELDHWLDTCFKA